MSKLNGGCGEGHAAGVGLGQLGERDRVPARWRPVAAVVCAGVVGFGMLTGIARAAAADPVPRPGHHGRHQAPRDHTVRCQRDQTDEIDEIAGDGEDTRQPASPLWPTSSGQCSRYRSTPRMHRLATG
jgi:hypothetical protein